MWSEEPRIEGMEIASYKVPTDQQESDGTLEWDHTGVVVVQVKAAGETGLGWSYASAASAAMASGILQKVVVGQSALAVEGNWQEMNRHLRNAGRPGAGMMAVAAIDIALWDLKAKLLKVALVDLFGPVREAVDIYGSGGFTSYTNERLAEQLGGWVRAGIGRVKMKVGRDAQADIDRVKVARKAIGDTAQLFVDANGGYTTRQALAMAERFHAEADVVWFEEPRSSDDLAGLHFVRERGPSGMDIAAGEYGDTPGYFAQMLQAGAVDCLQADATRCGGYTGFLKVGALCEAFGMPLSAHCAPQLHAHVACAVKPLRHVEYFHDHVRLDAMLFDGVIAQMNGTLKPDRKKLGHGMCLKPEATRFRTA